MAGGRGHRHALWDEFAGAETESTGEIPNIRPGPLWPDRAAAQTTSVTAFARKRPSRQPFPDHLPRERVVIPAPTSCPCCGSSRLFRLGETVTESTERVPASHKIIQTVREKVSCRDCERISQAPAPFHATPRGWAGPNLLASILVDKFAHHLPLNRQCERFAREGLPVSLSTAADQV